MPRDAAPRGIQARVSEHSGDSSSSEEQPEPFARDASSGNDEADGEDPWGDEPIGGAEVDDEVQALPEDALDETAPRRFSERYVTPRLRPAYRFIRRARAPLKPIVKSKWFEWATIFTIFYCSVVMGVDADISVPGNRHWFFFWSDFLTSILFIVEWGMRVVVDGVFWFKDWTNMIFTAAAWLPIVLVGFGERFRSFQVFARWLRVGKLVHSVKHVSGMKVIWLLVTGLYSSASTLFWSCVMIATTVSFFGLISVQLIGNNSVWKDLDEDSDSKIPMFRHVGSAMRVMMRFTNNDNALNILEELMTRQPYMWIFILTFMAISQYVLLNLVTAVICNNAMKVVMEDEERKAAEAEAMREQQMEELKNLFRAVDADGSNEVTAEEFDDAFEIPALQHKLLLLGIEEAELKRLFRALDSDGSASMNVDEFCQGVAELFGQATAYGMLRGVKTAERTEKKLQRFADSLQGSAKLQRMLGKPQVAEVLKKHASMKKSWIEENQDLEAEILGLEAEVDSRLEKLDGAVARLTDQALRMAASMKLS